MKTERTIVYARLSRARYPKRCSREEWFAWFGETGCHPVLAREPMDDWRVEIVFTGAWAGQAGERPKFFLVSSEHPTHSGERWAFATHAQAQEARCLMLEVCRQRAQEDVPADGEP
jgi:hypothetical protein